jgi:hypothetical protein
MAPTQGASCFLLVVELIVKQKPNIYGAFVSFFLNEPKNCYFTRAALLHRSGASKAALQLAVKGIAGALEQSAVAVLALETALEGRCFTTASSLA